MKDFVTVAVFNLPTDIAVLKSILFYEEILHFFENETIISVDPFASLAYGGIKLKVHQEDLERVKKILDDFESKLTII
jgi:hypothetical protein